MSELDHADKNRFAIVAVSQRTHEVIRLDLVPLSIVSYFRGTVAFRGAPQECIDYIAEELGRHASAARRGELVQT